MLASILVSLIGILVFLFIFWRRLKEDYSTDIVFSSVFIIVFTCLAGGFISLKFFPEWWFWGATFGIILGFTIAALRFSLRFYETVEAVVLGLFPWLIVLFITDSVRNSSLFSILYSVTIIAELVLFNYLEENYKNFTWYKSGRAGFSGLTILGIFFIIRAVIALFSPFVLSFVGKTDAILSGVSAFIVFLLLFNLSKVQQ